MSHHPDDNYDDISPFKKWVRVVGAARIVERKPVISAGVNIATEIAAVNKAVNRRRYIAEKKDYWKTPDEFLRDDGGDCEDFAIAKYYQLLGVPQINEDDLAICVCNRRADGAQHSVLRAGDVYLDIPEAVGEGNPTIFPWSEFYERFEKNNGRSYWINRKRWGRL